MHTRLFFLLAGLGLFSGCGKDEHVTPLIGNASDAGDETSTTGVAPTSVAPTTSAVNPAVNPVNPGPATSKLAAACATDAECGTGMKCLTQTGTGLFGGGPANGFCTVDCAADTTICETVQSGAVCIDAGDNSYCFPECLAGGAQATKCQGRNDVACDAATLSSSALSFCRPMCRTDADCGERKCRIGNGVCVDELPGEGDIGAPCDPEVQPSTDCLSGTCMRGFTPETETTGTCSGLCTLGTTGCNVPGQPGGGDAWCGPIQSGSTAGDMGVCSQICDCDDECSHESFRCLTFSEAATATFGINGICAEFDTDTTNLSDGFALGKECARVDAGSDDASSTDAGSEAGPLEAGSDAMSLPVEASLLQDSGNLSSDASGPGDANLADAN